MPKWKRRKPWTETDKKRKEHKGPGGKLPEDVKSGLPSSHSGGDGGSGGEGSGGSSGGSGGGGA